MKDNRQEMGVTNLSTNYMTPDGDTPQDPLEGLTTGSEEDIFASVFKDIDLKKVAHKALSTGPATQGNDDSGKSQRALQGVEHSMRDALQASNDMNAMLRDIINEKNQSMQDLNDEVYGSRTTVTDSMLNYVNGAPSSNAHTDNSMSMAEQLMNGSGITVSNHNNPIQEEVVKSNQGRIEPVAPTVTSDEPHEMTDEERAIMLEEGMKGMTALIGLEAVKKQIAENKAAVQALMERQRLGLLDPDDEEARNIGANTVFLGPPGTGKTTVARYWAKILAGLGILDKGQLIETDRSGLVAGYQGQTAPKVNQVIDSALGGVLFIDEVYNLNNSSHGGEDTFGLEAISTLLKRMEDDRGKFVVIIAGYTNETEQFLDSNPGLRSRFTDKIEFKDYSTDELVEIFTVKAKAKGVEVTDDNKEQLALAFDELRPLPSFSNGRTARVLLDNVMKAQSVRYADFVNGHPEVTEDESRAILTEFTREDIQHAADRTIRTSQSLESPVSRFSGLLGSLSSMAGGVTDTRDGVVNYGSSSTNGTTQSSVTIPINNENVGSTIDKIAQDVTTIEYDNDGETPEESTGQADSDDEEPEVDGEQGTDSEHLDDVEPSDDTVTENNGNSGTIN